ncbi:hypothetical protein ACLKA7_001482 [Drosophila subpalustris]
MTRSFGRLEAFDLLNNFRNIDLANRNRRAGDDTSIRNCGQHFLVRCQIKMSKPLREPGLATLYASSDALVHVSVEGGLRSLVLKEPEEAKGKNISEVDHGGSGRSMHFLNQILSSDVNVVRGIQNIGRIVDKQRCQFALKRPNARASRKKPSLEEKLQLTCSCVKAIGVPEGNVYSKISHDERKKKLEKQAELQIEEQKQIPVDQAGET